MTLNEITNVNKDIIITCFSKKRTRVFWASLFFMLIMLGYTFFNYIDTNQKFSIECNKIQNLCTVTTEKYLLGKKVTSFNINKIGDAYLHTVGCHKRRCYYKIIFPYANNNDIRIFKMYNSSENIKLLNWIISNFNEMKNNPKLSTFKIASDYQKFINILTLLSPFILIAMLFTIFNFPLKWDIIINNELDKFIIKKYYLIGIRKKILKISQISKLELKSFNYYTNVRYLEYTLKNNKKGEVFRLLNEVEKAEQIYTSIKNILYPDKI